jgi:hypothetical protein
MHAPGPHRSVGYLLAGIFQRKVGKSDWHLGWCDVLAFTATPRSIAPSGDSFSWDAFV